MSWLARGSQARSGSLLPGHRRPAGVDEEVVALDDEVHAEGPGRIRPPEAWTQLLEHRVPFEVGALLAASPVLRMLGRGDRHPVLVLPGFTGSDSSTVA